MALKQVIIHLNTKLTLTLSDLGLNQSKYNNSLFTKKNDIYFIVILIYFGDLILTDNSIFRNTKNQIGFGY